MIFIIPIPFYNSKIISNHIIYIKGNIVKLLFTLITLKSDYYSESTFDSVRY